MRYSFRTFQSLQARTAPGPPSKRWAAYTTLQFTSLVSPVRRSLDLGINRNTRMQETFVNSLETLLDLVTLSSVFSDLAGYGSREQRIH